MPCEWIEERLAELPAGPGPLPAWKARVRIRILRERAAAGERARTPRRRGPARAWILAYAAVIALFTVAELSGYASARTFERQAIAEREDLARQLESAMADIELVEMQLSISLQISHIAHAWATGREDLAQARLAALEELSQQLGEALAEHRRVRAL